MSNDTTARDEVSRKVGFVSAGIESQSNKGLKVTANHEDIELPEEYDMEDDKRVEIKQKTIYRNLFWRLGSKEVKH